MTTRQARELMRPECEATMAKIDALPWPEQSKSDLVAVCQIVQAAIAAQRERAIDGRILPEFVRL